MRSYSTDTEPTGNLLTTCGNCRTSRCPAYSRFWAADTYHLMRADLTGGKTFRIPVSATLTTSSFGPLHNPDTGLAAAALTTNPQAHGWARCST
ncbi:replication initiator [Streptomyces sp. NRRL F-5630]|uniref:replication initiator n=1 Tax=Streptomyces sp. NRRL F-5630 TaxID=1463864 RepID=UPI003EBEFEA6